MFIAFKAINRGIEAKRNLDKEYRNEEKLEIKGDLHLADELNKLKDLHSKGIINEDEFKKAKQKILK